MPRGRKRKDPADAPIDGDYSLDQVVNKQPGWDYKLLVADDVPKFRARGYTAVSRGPDAAKPAYDMGSETDADYKAGGLTLYAAPANVAERFTRQAQQMADARMATIRSDSRKQGLHLDTFERRIET